jgi:hypothetical protein
MATQLQKINHINNVRTASQKLIEAINNIKMLKLEWDALGLSEAIGEGDFTDSNSGLTVTDISGIYTTMAAIETLYSSGHNTNLYKLI